MKKIIALTTLTLAVSFSQFSYAQPINIDTLSCGEFMQKFSAMSKQENGRIKTSAFLGALYGYAAGISETKVFNDNYMETTFKNVINACVKNQNQNQKVKGVLITAYTDVNAW